jgi:hypothetical protein
VAKIERIIIDARGDLVLQVQAAHAAITNGLSEGEIVGVRRDGKYFGIKCNKSSVRVYPQQEAR